MSHPEQERARTYLRDRGTLAPAAQVAAQVAEAFHTLESALEAASAEAARTRPLPGEWSVQEIADHLLVTNRASVDELRALVEGRSPGTGPIPAGLQSPDPFARPWPELLRELRAVDAEFTGLLASASDATPLEGRAEVVMVVNVKGADGAVAPLEWVEAFDWKAYGMVNRLHAIDHLHQARRVLRALDGTR